MKEPSRRRPYPTDLTDAQWAAIAPWVRRPAGPGAPTTVDLREVVNAWRDINRTGCAWRLLPHDFPNHNTVRYDFDRWTWDGTFARINALLNTRDRTAAGRDPQPSLLIVDSQTVKTSAAGGERGFDGGKNLNGRKRQLWVDVRGNLWVSWVHAADLADRDALVLMLEQFAGRFPRVVVILVDAGYRAEWLADLEREYGIEIRIAEKPARQKGFVVQPLRWIVERSIAWLGRYRRLVRDYAGLPEYSESWIHLASISRLLQRLFPDASAEQPYHRQHRTPALACSVPLLPGVCP